MIMKPFQTPLELCVQDPSGQIRRYLVKQEAWIGRSPEAPIPLRDPTLPERALNVLRASEDSVWIRSEPGAPDAKLGDLRLREAHLPVGVSIRLGESELRLSRLNTHSSAASLPETPRGVRAWQTCNPVGKALLWNVRKAAATPLSTYLAGETGTGKEVLAELLHAWSDRASGNFVPLNCAALSITLIESELFGHVKGAFTGAHAPRPGALLQAHNGTLFLDEVGDLPLDIQVKLLRFLENGEIRAVGSDHVSHANVRVVCATHKPLLKMVEEGRFRRDLYYRLASVTLEIPPLRDRPEDIEMLARHFAGSFGKTLSPSALLRLQSYSWPGNVRELRHAVERSCALSDTFSTVLPESSFRFLLDTELMTEEKGDLRNGPLLRLDEMERHLILKALKLTNGNRTKAAKVLGVARSTLFEMLRRHRVAGPRQPLWLEHSA